MNYKPGDVVRVVSPKLKNNGRTGLFIRHCDGICTVLLCGGDTVALRANNITLERARSKDVDYDECKRFISRSCSLFWNYRTNYVRDLCAGNPTNVSSGTRDIRKHFIDFIRYTYRDYIENTTIIISWDEMMAL